MREFCIKRNGNGDTRTAKKIPTFKEFSDANREHIRDVSRAMYEISLDIEERGRLHDYTKINGKLEPLFYSDLIETMKGKMNFEDGEWAHIHYMTERHHLSRRVPEDVNLIDVIEMIADCVCAGMARSGEVRPLEINETILNEAVRNTAEMIKKSIILTEENNDISETDKSGSNE